MMSKIDTLLGLGVAAAITAAAVPTISDAVANFRRSILPQANGRRVVGCEDGWPTSDTVALELKKDQIYAAGGLEGGPIASFTGEHTIIFRSQGNGETIIEQGVNYVSRIPQNLGDSPGRHYEVDAGNIEHDIFISKGENGTTNIKDRLTAKC